MEAQWWCWPIAAVSALCSWCMGRMGWRWICLRIRCLPCSGVSFSLCFASTRSNLYYREMLGGQTPTLCLVEERYLRRVPREALPIHVDAMPTVEIDGLMISMADVSADIDFGVACHATPSEARRFFIRQDE